MTELVIMIIDKIKIAVIIFLLQLHVPTTTTTTNTTTAAANDDNNGNNNTKE